MQEPKFDLVNFDPAEGKLLNDEVEAVLKKYNGQMVVVPFVQTNGTLAARAEVYKKVELVPKGVPSPFVDENGQPKEEGGVPEATA